MYVDPEEPWTRFDTLVVVATVFALLLCVAGAWVEGMRSS